MLTQHTKNKDTRRRIREGSSFRNKLIAELCKLLKIKHTFSSPHHPQGDGKCERMNHTLIKSLHLECKNQTEWADRIASVVMRVSRWKSVSRRIRIEHEVVNVLLAVTLNENNEFSEQ